MTRTQKEVKNFYKVEIPKGYSVSKCGYEILSPDFFIHQRRIFAISRVQPLLLKLVLNQKTVKSRMYVYTYTHTHLCVYTYTDFILLGWNLIHPERMKSCHMQRHGWN